MPVIKLSNSATLARDAIVLDLGDLRRQGDQLVLHARQQADAILKEARAERERIITGASEKGHADGLAKGLAEGRIKGEQEGRGAALVETKTALENLQKGWNAALGGFQDDRAQMLREARHDVLRLAVLVAEKVTRRSVKLNASAVLPQLEAVLGMLMRPTRLLVSVHPDDMALADQHLPALMRENPGAEHVQLVADPSLTRGSCIARSAAPGGGHIDASIDTQLDRIVAALLPGEARLSALPTPAQSEPVVEAIADIPAGGTPPAANGTEPEPTPPETTP